MKEQRKEQSDLFFFLVGILSVIAGALAYTYLSGGQPAAAQRQEALNAISQEYEKNADHKNPPKQQRY